MEDIPILVYTSSHGFGHATRVSAVLTELRKRRPGLFPHLRTLVPAHLFDALAPRLTHRTVALDMGMLQDGPFDVKVPETLRALDDLEARSAELVEQEVAAARELGIRMVFTDLPWLACRIGRRLGVPVAAMGNFSWSWIYEPFVAAHPGFARHVEIIRNDYNLVDILLGLPMSGGLEDFPRVERIPVVARLPTRTRDEVLAALDLPGIPGEKIVMLSVGGFDAQGLPLPDIPGDRGYRVLAAVPIRGSLPPHVRTLPRELPVPHPDLVAAADVVVGKLGFGLVAECLAQGRGILYPDRQGFREHACLVEGVEASLPSRRIPISDLLEGRLFRHLEEYFAAPAAAREARPVRVDGAAVAAARLDELLS